MSDNYPLFVSSIPAESGYLRVPKSNNNRNMKQIICILALLLMSVTTTKAQTSPATPSIRGKILTEEKQPIKFANIALLSEDSTFIQGTCSRSDGSFELLPPAPGNYLLQVSSIGYKALCQPCPTGSTHNWILQTDAVLLAETVITAARPVFRLKGGKLETSVRQTLLASLNDANDVLKHIPGLRSSDEGYTVFGKGTPVIYICKTTPSCNASLPPILKKWSSSPTRVQSTMLPLKPLYAYAPYVTKETVLAVISVQESPNGDAAAITDKSI